MRIAILTMTSAAFLVAAPLAAQTTTSNTTRQQPIAQKHTTHKRTSRRVSVAVLNGGYEVPAVDTRGTATAELTLNGSSVHYRVDVTNLRDVTGAYVHIGRSWEDAPAVADLYEGLKTGPVSGVLASGVLRMADVHGTSIRQLVRAIQQDDAYVTIHTRSHPSGEVRGQLRIQPVVAERSAAG